MITIEERIQKAKAHAEQLERQYRLELRRERQAEKKVNQRRNFIVGEMVVKYFPKLMDIMPMNAEENSINFKELEAFLLVLSADTDLVQELSQRAAKLSNV